MVTISGDLDISNNLRVGTITDPEKATFKRSLNEGDAVHLTVETVRAREYDRSVREIEQEDTIELDEELVLDCVSKSDDGGFELQELSADVVNEVKDEFKDKNYLTYDRDNEVRLSGFVADVHEIRKASGAVVDPAAENDQPAADERTDDTDSTEVADSTSELSCPGCGTTLEGEEKFCPECGHDLTGETCPECGADLDGDESFCSECGHALSK